MDARDGAPERGRAIRRLAPAAPAARGGDGADVGLREALRTVTSGVTVVTSRHGEDVHGLTVTAFAGVSLDPPTVLVCVAKDSGLHRLVDASGLLGISILAADQAPIAEAFARPGPVDAAVADVLVERGARDGRAPAVRGAAAFLDCRVLTRYDGSSHWILLGRVETTAVDPARAPLVYHSCGYRSLDADGAAP